MCAWRSVLSPTSRWSALSRQSHAPLSLRTLLSSGSYTGRVGQMCGQCRLITLRWKRLFPVVLRYAKRSLRTLPSTTPTTRPPSRYILFGVAGFLWERERISNEEVVRCLKQYEERVQYQSTYNAQHCSLQDSQPTIEQSRQNSLVTSDPWSLASFWSTITFGWFGNSQYENCSDSKLEGNVASKSMAEESEETSESIKVRVVDKSKQRKMDFVQKMTGYLESHSEKCLSQLPVVGMSTQGPSRVSFGAKLANRVTQLKSRVLSHVTEGAKCEVKGQEGDCCGSAIADLACLGIELHDHTCVCEEDRSGDWFQYKISEFEQDLYSHSSDQSELSYHFYPMVGLQERNKVAKAVDQLAALIQGSPLATVLQTIEQFTHAYDHVLGTDYHLDRSLAAYSYSVKTRWNQILLGVVTEMAYELQQLKGLISSHTSFDHYGDADSSADSARKQTQHEVHSVRGRAPTSTENFRTASHSHAQKQAKQNEKVPRVSDEYRASELEINPFHHFGDVHLPGDEEHGPQVSGQLGQELLSMLRMARLKVRQERQLEKADVKSTNVGREAITREVRSEETQTNSEPHSASLAGWELLAREKSDTVYRRLYKDTGLYQYKVIGRYHDITAKDYLEVQVNHELRKEWDTYVTSLDTVDSDPRSDCELIYWIMRYPFPLSSRDYVYVRKVWVSPEEDAIVFINRSVDHPDFPANSRYTRVNHYFSEMVIKPHSFIDELGFDYEFTYFDNPQLRLSPSVVNYVTTAAMPDFLSKVHQAAAANKKTNQTRQLVWQ